MRNMSDSCDELLFIIVSAALPIASISAVLYESLRLDFLKVKIICNAKKRLLQLKHHF